MPSLSSPEDMRKQIKSDMLILAVIASIVQIPVVWLVLISYGPLRKLAKSVEYEYILNMNYTRITF